MPSRCMPWAEKVFLAEGKGMLALAYQLEFIRLRLQCSLQFGTRLRALLFP